MKKIAVVGRKKILITRAAGFLGSHYNFDKYILR